MFWDRFYKLCKSRNTSPSHVVKESGIAYGQPTAWKNGVIPNTEALIKLADYFDVSIDFLLGRTDEP